MLEFALYLIGASIIGGVIGGVLRSLRNSKHTDSDSEFKQRGVTVNYMNKTVTIKKQLFRIEQIRRSWSDDKFAYFEVDDIKDPIKKIFFGDKDDAYTFISRFRLAYTKAEQAQS